MEYKYDDAYFDMEDKFISALGADPKHCGITSESSVGDFFHYHFYDITKENNDKFNLIIKHVEDTFGIKLDCNNKIVDIVKNLLHK